ncbi:MAG TPA: DUF6569 family protein [Vicinamibacterales bacterium]|nr:DUF6569 family protein [Vicinamibacterales bacterium]
MPDLDPFLSSLSLGSPTLVDGLGIYPLLRTPAAQPFYDTLSDAVRAGVLHITELSGAGSVPELRVVNEGARPVLIVDGEELVGAKQNRIVNLTVLVPARATITLPVTCVEAGRWRHVTDEFTLAERTHYASGRRSKLGQVSMSMRMHSTPRSDQSAVWSEIADKSARLGAHSPTAAAGAMYEQRRGTLDRMIGSIKPLDQQVGAVFTIRGLIAGFDAFDHPRTWAQMMPKLMRSYGLDALDPAIGGDGFATPDPQRFLDAMSRAACTAYPAIGAGRDLRFEGNGIVGAALDTSEGVVHAVAFPASDVVRPAVKRRFSWR